MAFADAVEMVGKAVDVAGVATIVIGSVAAIAMSVLRGVPAATATGRCATV